MTDKFLGLLLLIFALSFAATFIISTNIIFNALVLLFAVKLFVYKGFR